jgi:hypothetical protein
MKGNVPLSVVLAFSLAVVLAAPALPKSPPDRLRVEGPGLAGLAEITDATELATFSPWGRGFIDWDRGLVAVPSPVGQTYTVAFFLGGKKIYVVQYVPASIGESGYIYFPGPGDSDY